MPDDLPYRVSWSQNAIEALKELGRRMKESGQAQELGRVVRAIDERLRRDPLSLGEAYHTRGSVESHLAVHEFLALDLAVDAARKFVLVRACRALSGPGQ
jgi:hypothetical protein